MKWTDADNELWTTASLRVWRSSPRLFCESYFPIQHREKRFMEPWEFNLNQEYFDREISAAFGEDPYGPRLVHMLKDRQAMWSTYINGIHAANVLVIPGWHIIKVSSDEDNLTPHLTMLRNFINAVYDKVPKELLPVVETWSKDRIMLKWPDGNESSINFVTASSPTFGRGFSIDVLCLDEEADYSPKFVQSFMEAVKPALRPNHHEYHGSTPKGPVGTFYNTYESIKKGEIAGLQLIRFWYENPFNRIRPGSTQVIPAYRGPLVIGEEGAPGAVYETGLMSRLEAQEKIDGIPPEDRIRFRRWKIADYTNVAGRDPRRGLAMFQQEHMEDEETCWLTTGASRFDPDVMGVMLQKVRAPLRRQTLEPGFELEVYAEPIAGECYVAVMDSAEGLETSDKTAVNIAWVGRGQPSIIVARLVGYTGIERAVHHTVKVCADYNHAFLGIERSGGHGAHANATALRLGYGQWLYKAPKTLTESHKKHAMKPYGFVTTGPSKQEMTDLLVEDVNNRGLESPCLETVRTMMAWDPRDKEHTPDEIITLMGIQLMRRMVPGRIFAAARGADLRRPQRRPDTLDSLIREHKEKQRELALTQGGSVWGR